MRNFHSLISPLRVGQENQRNFTSHPDSVTNEKDVVTMLQERVYEMQCHSSGPVTKMFQLAKQTLEGPARDISRRGKLMVLDAGSNPADVGVLLAQEFPEVPVHIINTSPEIVQLALDKSHQKLDSKNVVTSGMNDLYNYEDDSFDLIITCFGLDVRLITFYFMLFLYLILIIPLFPRFNSILMNQRKLS